MSSRANGQPLWFVRPLELIDGAVWMPLDDEGHFFAGCFDAMERHINACEREDGRAWCAQEVER